MNRLVIIGNGFDLAHGLKTSYVDFINWYWEQRMDALLTEHKPISSDCLCELRIIKTNECPSWSLVFQNCRLWDLINCSWKYPPLEIIRGIKENTDDFLVTCSPLFERITQSIDTKGWVDIENDYYELLKQTVRKEDCPFSAKELNEQLCHLQTKLVEYLNTLEEKNRNCVHESTLTESIRPKDISPHDKFKVEHILGHKIQEGENIPKEEKDFYKPENVMVLSFNYTNLIRRYENREIDLNYIHGNLSEPKHIIFGYGDELDKDYQYILDKNDNELLKYTKSVKYLETDNYVRLLRFVESALYQVYIMGHSCGNSDRTLLNTIFEHKNCISIKPFYHKWNENADNYLELAQNISRNFTDMKLYRSRVVNKKQCDCI